jgi:hypothetical protein
MALPSDTQLASLRDNALPPGLITDASRYGEAVSVLGTNARLIGFAGAEGSYYYATLDDMDFLGYSSAPPANVLPPI